MVLQREKTENTVRKLLDAGEQLLLEQGYEGSTVNAILDRSGLSKGAFYHNFTSKDELFWSLLLEKVNQVRKGFWAKAEQNKNLLSPTEYMVRSSLALSLDPVIKTIYTYYHSKASHNAEAKQRVIDIHNLRRELAMESIGNAQKKGYIPEHVDIEEISTVVLAMSIGLGLQISADPSHVPFNKFVTVYQNVVLAMFQGCGFPNQTTGGSC